MNTDASNKSIGAVLKQKQNGIIRVIAYACRVLDPAERSYCRPTTRKELLSIVFALKFFHHYLLSVPFLLHTDHATLTSLLRSPEFIGQPARWLDLLAGTLSVLNTGLEGSIAIWTASVEDPVEVANVYE